MEYIDMSLNEYLGSLDFPEEFRDLLEDLYWEGHSPEDAQEILEHTIESPSFAYLKEYPHV